MKKHGNIIGKVFGRLTVLSESHKDRHYNAWLNCKCACGTETVVSRNQIVRGKTTSCGCYWLERVRRAKKVHGLSHHGAYQIWRNMMDRCYTKSHPAYHNYGGRGIYVEDRWHDMKLFISDMGEPPPKLTLERKNNDGPYSRENCCWETRVNQAKNMRTTRMVTIDGQTKCVAEWSDFFKIKRATVYSRIGTGWDIITALQTPSPCLSRRRST